MSGIRTSLWMGAKLKMTATGSWQSAMFREIFPFTGTVSMVRGSHWGILTLYSSNAHLRGLEVCSQVAVDLPCQQDWTYCSCYFPQVRSNWTYIEYLGYCWPDPIRALHIHEVARRVPLSRLLLETDAPYFAPSLSNLVMMESPHTK